VSGAEVVQLVVGLGNPGAGHHEDRHNVGFWLLDALAARLKTELRSDPRHKGELGRAGSGLRLLKPTTYMNLSGEAVTSCASYFRITPPQVLVVHDELDLPVGSVRLKRGGGHGGHNGLRSIEVAAYVLSRPPAAEREAITAAIAAVLDNFETIINGGFNRAMNTLNQRVAKPGE
jgi:peptidyl-tRNA hydrolase, PTH1 family